MKIRRLILLLMTLAGLLIVQFPANAEDRGLKRVVTPLVQGKYHALIIGNNNYRDKKGIWRKLATAANDARALADVLKKDYGFSNVTLLIDASLKDTLKALNKLSDQVGPEDSVLVYYAGHGHLEVEKNRGYWIPVDAVGGDISTYLRNSTIRDEINIIADRAKHTLIISDSCFSGDLMRTGGRSGDQVGTGLPYYEKVAKKKSVQVFTAGGKEFVDDSYRNSGHSPFTYFLLSELKSNNKDIVSLAEIATNVSIAVANNAEQTPESGVLLGAGDELGQFIFARVLVKKNGDTEVTVGSGKLSPQNEVIEFESSPVTTPKGEDINETFVEPAPRL